MFWSKEPKEPSSWETTVYVPNGLLSEITAYESARLSIILSKNPFIPYGVEVPDEPFIIIKQYENLDSDLKRYFDPKQIKVELS